MYLVTQKGAGASFEKQASHNVVCLHFSCDNCGKTSPHLGVIENEWHLNTRGAFCHYCSVIWNHGQNRSDSDRDTKTPDVNRDF